MDLRLKVEQAVSLFRRCASLTARQTNSLPYIKSVTALIIRLKNGFSKKFENLNYTLALHFAYYNFCRIYKMIRCTLEIEAELAQMVWTLKNLLNIKVK